MNLLALIIVWLSASVWIAPADTNQVPPDPPDDEELTQESEEAEPDDDFEEIEPYNLTPEVGYNEVLNDSLLRWEMLQSPSEWHFRQPGRITYRLGLLGRHDAALVEGHDPRHQRSFWGPVGLEDRVTGMTNPNRLPHYRFSSFKEQTRGITYQNRYQMRRFYVNRPLTQITLEQEDDEYRSAEGFLTQNITQRLNIEGAYWGKLEDSDYPANFSLGRKVWGGAYYHLSDRYILRGMILYNGLQMEEPGGYVMEDMFTFPFQPLNSVANLTDANSSVRNTMIKSSLYYRREAADDVNAQISAYWDRNRRFFRSDEHDTFYRVNTPGIAARYHIAPFSGFEIDLEASAEFSNIVSHSNESMAERTWSRTEARHRWAWPLLSWFKLDGWGELAYRSDGFTDGQIGAGFDMPLSRWLHLDGAYSSGEIMPTPQQLYWWLGSEETGVEGNPDLENENHRRFESAVTLFPEFRFRLEAGGQHKIITDPILIDFDEEFQQTGSYYTNSGYGKMGYYGEHLESEFSVTAQQYQSNHFDPVLHELSESGTRVWSRFSSYYQNYVFDRAAYIKGGFIGWFSPFSYRTGTYYPEMDYWDPNSVEQEIPGFARLDVELSGRVRNVIVRLRYENVLDDVIQPGYFEQALHPMGGRRFRLGIQWILRN